MASFASEDVSRLVSPYGNDAGCFYAKRVAGVWLTWGDDTDGRFRMLAVIVHKLRIYRVLPGIQYADAGISARRAGLSDDCYMGALEIHFYFAAGSVRYECPVIHSPMWRTLDFL